MAQTYDCGSEVKTYLLSRSYVFRWSIENFPKWPDTFELTSHEFKPLNERTFFLTFSKGKGDSYCSLKYFSKGKNKVLIKHIISVIDFAGKVFETCPYTYTYDENNNSFEYTYSAKDLIKYNDSTDDQVLIFNCVMEFGELSTTTVFRDQLMSSPTDNVSALINDLRTMYDRSLYSDFNLMVEDNVVPVHKSLLCTRSPVFAKMLKSNMKENIKDTIKISDIELPILKNFVEFLYTGNIPDAEFESVCALYYAADKYDVSSLRKNCADILFAGLDVENACRVLSLADRHSDNNLKDLVLGFMQFEFDALLVTESWIDFVKNETKLAIEVMKLRGEKLGKGGHQSESA